MGSLELQILVKRMDRGQTVIPSPGRAVTLCLQPLQKILNQAPCYLFQGQFLWIEFVFLLAKSEEQGEGIPVRADGIHAASRLPGKIDT